MKNSYIETVAWFAMFAIFPQRHGHIKTTALTVCTNFTQGFVGSFRLLYIISSYCMSYICIVSLHVSFNLERYFKVVIDGREGLIISVICANKKMLIIVNGPQHIRPCV